MEADEKTVEARWQVVADCPVRGRYIVARPLTAAEAQVFADGVPFPAEIEPLASGEGAMIPEALRASRIPGSSRHTL